MKKLIVMVLTFALSFSCFGLTAFADDKYFTDEQIEYYKNLGLQGTTVNFYNWGEYISEGDEGAMNVIAEFERLTGAKVNYSNYESNENMYSKLSGGGVSYDIIVPSDYMIERLIDEDMLLELNLDNIPNFQFLRENCKNLYYDPDNKYSVCFNTGYTVLIYNKKIVKQKPDSWKVLWDEQYRGKVLMFNNSRDAFAIAQAVLNQDFNTSNEQDWVDAANLLAEQKDTVNPVYVMDEVFNLMESGEYALATYYAGDYLLMLDNNEDLGYSFPKEGVNAFYDAFCIPKCSQNKKGAEAFINFMHEPQVALANEEYIYYASSNRLVEENEENSLYENQVVYPENEPESQSFKNLPQNILELQNNLWNQVKSGKLSSSSKNREKTIYTEFIIVLIAVAVFVICRLIQNIKKKKEQDLSEFYK